MEKVDRILQGEGDRYKEKDPAEGDLDIDVQIDDLTELYEGVPLRECYDELLTRMTVSRNKSVLLKDHLFPWLPTNVIDIILGVTIERVLKELGDQPANLELMEQIFQIYADLKESHMGGKWRGTSRKWEARGQRSVEHWKRLLTKFRAMSPEDRLKIFKFVLDKLRLPEKFDDSPVRRNDWFLHALFPRLEVSQALVTLVKSFENVRGCQSRETWEAAYQLAEAHTYS